VSETVEHLGIIMDGNGRWATRRHMPRTAGHRAGVEAAKRAVEAVRKRGIPYLTLYAFSSDNWGREPSEVQAIFRLVDRFFASEIGTLVERGIRTQVIGRRDRLPPRTRRLVQRAEAETLGGSSLHLRIAVDYSSRDAIVAAAQSLAQSCVASGDLPGTIDRDTFFEHLSHAVHSSSVPDIDLAIRTSGEKRLSDFCLWECAYAELHFTDTLWPDFCDATLAGALADFATRRRRFGSVPKLEQYGDAS